MSFVRLSYSISSKALYLIVVCVQATGLD